MDKKLSDHVELTEPKFVNKLLAKGDKVLAKNGSKQKLLPMKNSDVLCHTRGGWGIKRGGQLVGCLQEQHAFKLGCDGLSR